MTQIKLNPDLLPETRKNSGASLWYLFYVVPQEAQDPGWTTAAPVQATLEGGAAVRLACSDEAVANSL